MYCAELRKIYNGEIFISIAQIRGGCLALAMEGIRALYSMMECKYNLIDCCIFFAGLIDSRLSKQQKKMAFKIIRPYNDGYGKQNNSTVLK